MSHTLKTIITLSLLLNLLLAGFIIGTWGCGMMQSHIRASIADTAKTLPEEKRDHFEAVMNRAEKDAKPLFAELEADRLRAIKLLKTEPFNKKAFLAQVKEMEVVHGQLKQQMAKAIVQASDDLNAHERGQLAELLRRPGPPPSAKPKTTEER